MTFNIYTILKKIQLSLFLGLAVCFTQSNFAQSKSEISLTASGIFNKLDYESENGYLDNSRNGSFGIGYGFYFNTQWSINIGAEYQFFKANVTYNNLELSSNATDIEGESFIYNYNATKYEEEQKVSTINIPLTLQFQTDGDTKFYARAGAQVSLISSAEYSTSIRSLTTSGYYEQYNAELFDPEFMGFGTFTNLSQKDQELELDTSIAAVIEAGVKTEVGDSSHLYLGFFYNYGINTINSSSNQENLVEYNTDSPTDLSANSLLNTELTDEVRLVSYGLKLRFAFGGY